VSENLADILAAAREALANTPEGKIASCIRLYDKYVAARHGGAVRERPPTGVMKRMNIWKHMSRMFALAHKIGAEPPLFLRAQFEMLPDNIRVYPPMLYSPNAVTRWEKWTSNAARKYTHSLEDASRAINVDMRATLHRALEEGHAMWARLGEPNPVHIATTMPGVVPGPFLLCFEEVKALARSGEVDVFGEWLAVLDEDPSLWVALRRFKENMQ